MFLEILWSVFDHMRIKLFKILSIIFGKSFFLLSNVFFYSGAREDHGEGEGGDGDLLAGEQGGQGPA